MGEAGVGMNSEVTVKVEVRYRAWLAQPYLWGVAFVCRVFGAEPDMEKVAAFLTRWCVVVRACK